MCDAAVVYVRYCLACDILAVCHLQAFDIAFSSLHTQLEATNLELQQTKDHLQAALEASHHASSQLAETSTAKAALERRTGALKVLLAEHVRDNVNLIKALELCEDALGEAHIQLQKAEQQKTASEAVLADKVRQPVSSLCTDRQDVLAWQQAS